MSTFDHGMCWLHEPCEHPLDAKNCPKEKDRLAIRARDVGSPWAQLELVSEGVSGKRHYLDGQPIHCGVALELQVVEPKADDYGEYSKFSEKGVIVRYEATWTEKGILYSLHADVGGHEFATRGEPWFRFRWPKRSR